MLKLYTIEFFKLRNTKYFWILAALFVVFLLSVPIGAKVFLNYLNAVGQDFLKGFTNGNIPLFDFVDLWQNLTFVYKSFSIFLGFILVISVTNEFNYGTVKQNIIDGLSPVQFLWTKIQFIIVNSLVFSMAASIIGLIMGFLWSPVRDLEFVFKNIEFIGAYFLHLVVFQLFCMAIALLIKRSGLTIALLIFYLFIIEPIVVAILTYEYKMEWLADLFPANAIGNIIRNPFPKYILRETQTFIAFSDLAILSIYGLLFYCICHRLVARRDIR